MTKVVFMFLDTNIFVTLLQIWQLRFL